MSLRSAFQTAYAAIKTTASGVVEWLTGSESLPALWDAQDAINQYRTIAICDDAATMQALGTEECQLAFVKGVTLYYYAATNIGGNGLASTDGGYWIPHIGPYEILFTSLGLMGNGDVPMWNSGLGKFVGGAPTVASLGYGNITGKPSWTGTTNPATTGNVTIGGTLGVTGAGTIGSIAVSGNATVGGTLGVTGNVSINTNKFTVSAANGNTIVGGTLFVTGTSLLDNNVTVSGDTTLFTLLVNDAASFQNGILVTGNVSATGFYSALPVYANNATALGALGTNRFYRTGDAVMITH